MRQSAPLSLYREPSAVTGGPRSIAISGGSVYFKSDAREHTLCYFEGDPADSVACFEVEGRGDRDDAAAQLETLGHRVRRGTPHEAGLRKVSDFIAFRDPSGNLIELAWRPAHSGRRYHGMRDAGVIGFSNVGLYSSDTVRHELFWSRVTTAKVRDRIGNCSRRTGPIPRPTPEQKALVRAAASALVRHGPVHAYGHCSLGLDDTRLLISPACPRAASPTTRRAWWCRWMGRCPMASSAKCASIGKATEAAGSRRRGALHATESHDT